MDNNGKTDAEDQEPLKNTYRKEEDAVPDPVLEQQVKPIGDRVICRRQTKDEEVQGGIIIPDIAKEKNQEAIVVSVGPGMRCEATGERVPVDIKAGMHVILPRWGGVEVEIKKVKYQIVREDEIIAVKHNPEEEKTDDGKDG